MTRTFVHRLVGGALGCALVGSLVLVVPGAAWAVAPTALSGQSVSRVIGGTSSCAVTSDRLVCWGRNDNGTLADGSTTDRTVPQDLSLAGSALAGHAIVDASGRGDHACAVSDEGAVACWGDNQVGQLGLGIVSPAVTPLRLTPIDLPVTGTALDGKVVVQVVTGTRHTCALTADSQVACWGLNSLGQLGDGTTTNRSDPTAVDTSVAPLAGHTIVSLAAGADHTCALADDSVIACWGAGANGQLGNGVTGNSSVPVAMVTTGTPLADVGVVQIAAGAHHTCALSVSGYVSCWGSNAQGALGNGGGIDRSVPTAVDTASSALVGRTVRQVAASGDSTCVIATDTFVACWGDNSTGSLGDGTTVSRAVPTAVITSGTRLRNDPAATLSMGECTLVATDGGIAVAWGSNAHGCLGDGTTTNRTRAVPVATGVSTVPLPPAAVTATVTGRTITASWLAPSDNGGSAITSYRVDLLLAGAAGTQPQVVATQVVAAPGLTHAFTALSPGGPYTVVAYATNAVGESAASDPSEQVAIDPLTGSATSMTNKPAFSVITYGKQIPVATTLTAVPRGSASGFAVQLWQRIGTASWTRVCSVTTSSAGTASCNVKPARTTSYQWRFAGVDLLYLPATSATVRVSVRVAVSASLSPTSIRLGQSSSLRGSIAPGSSNAKVYLQTYSNRHWVNVSFTRTNSKGAYRLIIKPKKKGALAYRAYRYGDSSLLSNYSSKRTLRVS